MLSMHAAEGYPMIADKSPRLITSDEWTAHRRTVLRSSLYVPGGTIPDVLLPYQQELLATTAAHPVTVVEKSRRTGFTWAAGADAVLTAGLDKAAGGMDVLYLGYNLDMAREFIDTCAWWATSFGQAASAAEECLYDGNGNEAVKAFRISFASGFEILALTSKPRSLRGRQGYVILDEAAFHDDLAEVLKAAMALLIWGGRILVLSTHDGDANVFNTLATDIRAGRKDYAIVRCDFDEALNQGLYQRICLATGKAWSPEAEAHWRNEVIGFYGEAADEELFCIPTKGKGAFLSSSLIEARMQAGIPVIRWEQPASFAEWPEHLRKAETRDFCERELLPLLEKLDRRLGHAFGQDFGRVSDLSVMWPLTIRRDLVRETPFTVELRNIPFECQKDIAFYIIDRLPRFMAGAFDSTGNGAYLGEVAMQRYGAGRIEQVKFSVSWYRDNMPKYKAAFEDANIIIPKDADILADHRLIKLIDGVGQMPSARTKAADGTSRHGDSAIAGVLAYHATTMNVAEYSYEGASAPVVDWRTPGDNQRQVRVTGGFKKQGIW
jgi:phage FluMu gp28-like protein